MEQSDQKQLKLFLDDLSNFSTRIVDRLQSDNEGDNLVISPISIANALALLLPGAKGETYKQIQQVLGLQSVDSLDKIKQIFVVANQHFKNMNCVKIANAVAYHSEEIINEEYHQTLKSIFEADGFSFDFDSDADRAIFELNHWVEKQTNGKITNIVDSPLPTFTRLILLNTIYFLDNWEYPFDERRTHPDKFYYAKDKWNEVEMMEKFTLFGYAEFSEGQLLEMSYQVRCFKDGRFIHVADPLGMLIYLPTAGDFDKPQFNLDQIEHNIDKLQLKPVSVSLPKFKIECKMLLKETLRKLGIQDAFVNGLADFSPINGNHELYLHQMTHKTFVEVNEKGTEAAAVSYPIMRGGGGGDDNPVPTFRVNRPFMFMIRSRSGVNLFTGIVNKIET